tara:strand:+ start:279 stop:464 length:186 start_codon:yes stop_codon:yes gene_type:complete
MPFYTFKCPTCNKKKELLQSMNTKAPHCKSCDIVMKRLFGNIGKPQFKGKGFYETDYKKKS